MIRQQRISWGPGLEEEVRALRLVLMPGAAHWDAFSEKALKTSQTDDLP